MLGNFKKDLNNFKNRISNIKEHLNSEEATKMALVVPFINLLGYDVFNPLEVVPEYVADVGIKKGEKVDYAILQDNNPLMLIEAKCIGEDLSKHYSQLYRYFTTTPSKFAILTDGVIYRFYSDIEEVNIMDSEPFIEIDLFNLNDNDVILLSLFRKGNFSVDKVSNYIIDWKYNNDIRLKVSELFSNPSDELVSLIVGDKNMYKLRGIVEKVLSEYVHKDEISTDVVSKPVKVVKDINYADVITVSLGEFKYNYLKEQYNKVKPISLCVSDEELPLDSWKGILPVAFNYLYKHYKILLYNYIDKPFKYKKVLLYSSKELLEENYKIGGKESRIHKVDDGVYMYINYSPGSAIEFVIDILELLNLPKDYFTLKYSLLS